MSFQVILIIHIILALGLVALILIQHGKGADAGAAFGSGSSGSVFGARGANSFLYKLTASIATGFFLTSLTLAYLATNEHSANSTTNSVMSDVVATEPVVDVPTVDVPIVDDKPQDIPK